MVPGAGLEPARPFSREILSLLCLPIPSSGQSKYGGAGRNRTGVHGVAVRCMTTLPPRLWVNHTYLSILPEQDWSGISGSNRRPEPWQGSALPTELIPHASEEVVRIIDSSPFMSTTFQL